MASRWSSFVSTCLTPLLQGIGKGNDKAVRLREKANSMVQCVAKNVRCLSGCFKFSRVLDCGLTAQNRYSMLICAFCMERYDTFILA